jgi:biopolymer transport protein ExbD
MDGGSICQTFIGHARVDCGPIGVVLKFRKSSPLEPEINLIPFIDVLLVIVIFLLVTTTWSHFSQLNLTMPTASAESGPNPPTWEISVSAQGDYALNGVRLQGRSVSDIRAAMQALPPAQSHLLIRADALASHQAVVNVMEAAKQSGLSKIAFAAQAPLASPELRGKGP